MQIKIHKSYRQVVAICDTELLGKKFEQDIFQLDIKESFFKGEEFNEEETKKLMQSFFKEDATFNIVGEKSIQLALETGIVQEQGIKKIQDIPFAMLFL